MTGIGNPTHIALVLVVLLLVFGAKRLPEMGRSLGAGLRGFKDTISGEGITGQLQAAPLPAAQQTQAVAQPEAETASVRPAA